MIVQERGLQLMNRMTKILAISWALVLPTSLYALAEGLWTQLSEAPPLFDSIDMAVDGTGALWLVSTEANKSVKSQERGVYRYDGNSWSYMENDSGYYSNHVFAVESAPDGSIWTMNLLGLSRYDGSRWENHPYTDAVADFSQGRHHLDIGQDGVVWGGTNNAIFSFLDGVMVKYGLENGLPYKENVMVYGLASSGDGKVSATFIYTDNDITWIEDGVEFIESYATTCLFDSDAWKITYLNRITQVKEVDYIFSSIAAAPDGALWCSYESAFWRLEDDIWQPKYRGDYLGYSAMSFDSEGNIWASSRNGIAVYDGETLTEYSEKDGVPPGMIVAICAGENGVVWAATGEGLAKFTPGGTAVEMETPVQVSLDDVYPNPFNGTATISFKIPERMPVSLQVYNCAGQKAKTLYSGIQVAGSHSYHWDGVNDHGEKVSSGIYFVRLAANNTSIAKRMIYLK